MIGESNRQREEGPMGGHGTGVSWERLAEEAAGMPEGSECGDLLVPWQTVEFVSGMSRVWGKLAEGDRERVGWTRQVSVPGAVRLTLSVQTVPRWDPEGPEVGMGAANSELFPPCVFTVAAGSAGCRMARDFWEVLCREHGLREGDGVPRFGRPTGNWRGFFREETGAGGVRYWPHALFADLDAAVIGELGARELFPRGGLLDEGLDAGYTGADVAGEAGQRLRERALAFLDGHSSEAGSPSVILFFSSLEGSAGGRLGGLMLSQLRERYPAVPVLVVGVLPHAKPTADPAVAWHAALALQRIRREAAAAVLFSNDVLIRRAGRLWETGGRSGYGAANQLIAEALAAVTGPLRFGGRDTAAADPMALIEALGSGEGGWPPLVTAHNWPLGRLSFLKSPQPRLGGVVAAAVRFARRQKGFSEEMSALGIYLRGRWHEAAAAVGRRRGERVQTVALTGRTCPWAYESLTVVASSPEIEESLERIARRAASHLRRFPEAVAAAGIDRAQLGAAIRALRERQAGRGEGREPGGDKLGEAPLVAGEFDWG